MDFYKNVSFLALSSKRRIIDNYYADGYI